MDSSTIDFRKIKILVIDDEKEFAEGVAEILQSRGFKVEVALSGRHALDKYNKTSFDLVISDLKMPEMDGIELIKEIRHLNPCQRIIVLTGVPGQLTPWNPKLARSRHDALFFSSLERLIKPFRPAALIDLITRVLTKKDNGEDCRQEDDIEENEDNRVTAWDFLKDEVFKEEGDSSNEAYFPPGEESGKKDDKE
jgi:DNA-binding response OmpR family regulator